MLFLIIFVLVVNGFKWQLYLLILFANYIKKECELAVVISEKTRITAMIEIVFTY